MTGQTNIDPPASLLYRHRHPQTGPGRDRRLPAIVATPGFLRHRARDPRGRSRRGAR